MFEVRGAGPREHRSELRPGVGGAHVDNAHRFDTRLRRLDTKQPRRLATFDAAPELPLRRDDEVLIQRVRMGGEPMQQSKLIKRELASSVSNSQIDDIYEAGRDAGAVGGKLLGGGGLMVLLVDSEKRVHVRERRRKLIHVNVGFDTDGSKIVIYQQ
jgi:galactokinase/mevalonate kinase-like predicted kinase